jgi:hypothetical protein
MGRLDDVPIKKDNPPAPEWVTEGVVVVHDTFGRGVVRRVGLYKRFHTIWVDFEKEGGKALSPKYAMPHMRLAESDTPPEGPASQAVSRLRSWVRRGR